MRRAIESTRTERFVNARNLKQAHVYVYTYTNEYISADGDGEIDRSIDRQTNRRLDR